MEGWREAGGQGGGGGAGTLLGFLLGSEETAGSCILSGQSTRRVACRQLVSPKGVHSAVGPLRVTERERLNRGVTSRRGAALWPV